MKQIQGGVTAAKGFEAAGVEAAIKYQNRKDMALIVSKAPCTVAGTFTSNVVKAAPVLWDKQIVEHSAFAQAVVVNSGIANACTGKQGLDCCEAEAKCAGELLGVPTDAVLVASTGVIGMQIPVDKITAGIEKLVAAKADTLEAGSDAAHAIMTTDTISKEIAIETQIGGKTVTLGGMCKGSFSDTCLASHIPISLRLLPLSCHRCENFQGDAAEVRQRRCSGFLQHDLRGWRYFHK